MDNDILVGDYVIIDEDAKLYYKEIGGVYELQKKLDYKCAIVVNSNDISSVIIIRTPKKWNANVRVYFVLNKHLETIGRDF